MKTWTELSKRKMHVDSEFAKALLAQDEKWFNLAIEKGEITVVRRRKGLHAPIKELMKRKPS